MSESDRRWMREALDAGSAARRVAPPNPWVGAVLVDEVNDVLLGTGRTSEPGGWHAEVMALSDAGISARGATMFVTLEPCSHTGRTPPCVEAIIAAGVARVVVGVEDPDVRVSGQGIDALRRAGITVDVGCLATDVTASLRPYLHQRRTGRPYVVAKIASTLDGIVAVADGTSQWITGEDARRDGHELRADSDVIIVGAGTVRADNPSLTARPNGVVEGRQPKRVVLGKVAPDASVRPCREYQGDVTTLLEELGKDGALQVLVEGGPRVISSLLEQRLVDHVVWYLAPAIAGSEGATAALASLSTHTISELRRYRFSGVRILGSDVRLDVEVSGAEHN